MAGTRLKGGARRQAVKTRCSRAIQGKHIEPGSSARWSCAGHCPRRTRTGAAHRQGTRPAREQGKPRRRSTGQSLGSRPAPANVRGLHWARGGNSPLHGVAMEHGAADALISVRLAIEESRCKPWLYPVEKRFHRRFSGRGSYGILRLLQRSDPLALPPPAGLCRASPERP